MATNWKQLYALKREYGEKIKKIAPSMENRPGIYVWYRKKYCFYAGQSVKLLDRSIQHLQQHDHLGLSIRKHGLYDEIKNPYGWNLIYCYCDESELNEKERETIARWAEHNIAYNITSGGQDSGKVDINQRAATKGYRDGLKQGYYNCLKEMKGYFDKYLNFITKHDKECYKQNGELKEIYTKKFNELRELLDSVDKITTDSEKVGRKGENE